MSKKSFVKNSWTCFDSWSPSSPPKKTINKKERRRLQISCFLYVFPWKVKAQYYMACAMTAIHHLHQLRVMLRSLKPEAAWIRFCCCFGWGRDGNDPIFWTKNREKHVYIYICITHIPKQNGWTLTNGEEEYQSLSASFLFWTLAR